uniref:Uncharacterized protein n=1 Tax=Anopheles dirus TaxID=7168 RepID=A0A182NWH6_9DIPT
ACVCVCAKRRQYTLELGFPREILLAARLCSGKPVAQARLHFRVPLPCAKSCAEGEKNRAEKWK